MIDFLFFFVITKREIKKGEGVCKGCEKKRMKEGQKGETKSANRKRKP